MAETLFGPTPEDLQRQYYNDRQSYLDRAAQLGPSQSAGAAIGTLLGGVVGSIFGIENPELKQARVMQDIQKKLRAANQGTMDKGSYYDQAAYYFDEAGMPTKALEAMNMANEWRISQEDKALDTEYKQAQIGNLKSEAEARLAPKKYEAASPIGKLRADLAYATSIGDTETVKAIQAEIDTETAGKKLKPQEKADQVIYDALIKEYGGDETKAARAFSRISVNQKKEIQAAGAGESVSKALQMILENSKVQDKQASIKAVDTKLYTDNLATLLNETYPDVTEAEQAKMLSDFKNAKKHALRSNMSEDEAEAYANERISKGIMVQKGRFIDSTVYKSTPLGKVSAPAAETPAKSDTGLPPGSKAGKKVTSGPNAGKVEVLDKSGKLIGYADQGTK